MRTSYTMEVKVVLADYTGDSNPQQIRNAVSAVLRLGLDQVLPPNHQVVSISTVKIPRRFKPLDDMA